MARYTVHMTFEVSALPKPLKTSRRLPGRAASIRLLGADELLAVTASRVQAESPAEAAMIVVTSVHDHWSKSQGPIKMLSWTAGRERVLVGARRAGRSSGSGGPWPDGWEPTFGWDDGNDDRGDDEGGGSAGVREPRRPLPGPGSMHAAVDRPGQ